jgi:SulP family sulfate permease
MITLFVGRLAALIPMATLAAILVVVSYHMSEWRTFVAECRSPKSDVAVLLTTFGLTVFVDLTVAISVGMVLSAFLFIRRMATVTSVTQLQTVIASDEDTHARADRDSSDYDDRVERANPDRYVSDRDGVRWRNVPRGVEVYEINGPFFFGAAATFRDTLGRIAETPRVLIIRMRDVLSIDSTAMHALRELVRRTRKNGTTVLLSDVHMQPLVALTGSPTLDAIGKENLFADLDGALARARELIATNAIA